jgi:RNA-binding protein
MPLTEKQKKHLRALGHSLKPVILTGAAGLTESLVEELDRALTHHELLKVRVSAEDREARDRMIATLSERSGAELVQRVGHVALLYRRNPERPRIELPSATASRPARLGARGAPHKPAEPRSAQRGTAKNRRQPK